ncbi:hypothetical protein BH10PSE19_BH10PSE19_07070 [soil metagenome]
MPATTTFDTLQYAKKAKKVGFTEKQAEFQAETIANLLNDRLITKQELIKKAKDAGFNEAQAEFQAETFSELQEIRLNAKSISFKSDTSDN